MAAEDGWSVAKSVALRKAGKFNDPEYVKVMEQRAKDAKTEKDKTAKKPKFAGYRQFGGFQPAPGFMPQWPGPMGYGAFPNSPAGPGFQPPQQKRTAGPHSQCFNCQNMGHFARDCPSKPSALGAPPK